MPKKNLSSFVLFTLALIVPSYYWLDRSIVDYVSQHHFRQYRLLDDVTHIPEIFTMLIPIPLLMLAFFRYKHRPLANYQVTLVLMSISLLISGIINRGLKFVFARYWPDTWINNNPSWLQDHAYGFNWFDFNVWYASFPSGHTTATFACMSIIYYRHPKLRITAGIICGLVIAGLLGMYYHFLSDIIAGALLGSICGCFLANNYNQYQLNQ